MMPNTDVHRAIVIVFQGREADRDQTFSIKQVETAPYGRGSEIGIVTTADASAYFAPVSFFRRVGQFRTRIMGSN
jgi:hypothetical protein